MASDGFRLPGYLRLLFLLNSEGKVMVSLRREYGFRMNDVHMLQAFGLIREHNGFLELTDKGREFLKEVEDALLGKGVGKFRKILHELVALIDNVLSKVEEYAKIYDGYWLEETWVHNKLKTKYYYYYLKSRTRKPRSIYLGRKPVPDYYLLRDLKAYKAKLTRLQEQTVMLLTELQHLEVATYIVENLEKTQKKIAQIKAKDIPVDSRSS